MMRSSRSKELFNNEGWNEHAVLPLLFNTNPALNKPCVHNNCAKKQGLDGSFQAMDDGGGHDCEVRRPRAELGVQQGREAGYRVVGVLG
jgi:hypothetical protein